MSISSNLLKFILLSSALNVPLFAREALAQVKDPGIPSNLNGRINDILQPSVPNLNLQKDGEGIEGYKSSTPPQKGKILKGFPQTFEGAWSGAVVIDQFDFAPDILAAQPDQTELEKIRMHPGRESVGSVTFVSTADGITFGIWPQFTFTVGMEDAQLFKPGSTIKPGMQFFIGTAPAKNAILADGNIKNSRHILNRITEFKQGAIEEDSQELSLTQDPKTHIQRVGARENIMHFLLISPTEMQISIAQVDYRGNGAFQSKLVMHGTLKRRSGPNTASLPDKTYMRFANSEASLVATKLRPRGINVL